MKLLLMRHGDAVMLRPDANRPLSATGIAEVRANARRLAGRDWQPSHIIASPLQRAAETANLIAASLACDGGITSWPALSPAGASVDVLALLLAYEQAEPGFACPLLVTHQPFIGDFIEYLTAKVCMMHTASIAAIELDLGSPHESELIWLLDAHG
jgi:phosphohistidine phosphatase